jgi:serine/threonine-protein kinase RsbW
MVLNGTTRSGPMAGEDQEPSRRGEELGTGGDVRLVVPAAPEYLRLVRLTAAGLASRLGFTFDEVEDLRIAVDELCFHLLGDADEPGPSDEPRTMDLTYSAGADYISITGSTGLSGAVPEPSELSEQILDALVDEHDVSGSDGLITFRLKKQRES